MKAFYLISSFLLLSTLAQASLVWDPKDCFALSRKGIEQKYRIKLGETQTVCSLLNRYVTCTVDTVYGRRPERFTVDLDIQCEYVKFVQQPSSAWSR